jgi:uroporphyrinogen decarboxylase
LRERALELRVQGDWAIVLHLPSSFVQHTQILRGFSDWYIDAASEPVRLGALIDQVLEIQMGICGNVLDQVGDVIDVVFNYDDLAMQDRLIVSPAMYRKLLEPRLRRFIEFLKCKTRAKIVHHTDGAVIPILDSLADMGIDAINPVQVSAVGMNDTASLKQCFGKRLAFWGAIDTQHVLPFGSPADVQAETRQRIRDLNQNGGYVLCSAHNIQSDVPPENIVSIYDSTFGKQLV